MRALSLCTIGALAVVLTVAQGIPRPLLAQVEREKIVTCESSDAKYTRCRTEMSGKVRLLKQISQAACVQGRTWGYDRYGIWVTKGCRGQFEISRGGGVGAGPNIPARARTACEEKARSAGYSAIQVVGTAPSGEDVTVRLRASDRGQLADIVCLYRTTINTAVMTQQSAMSPRKVPADAALLGRAKAACEAAAKQQGYEVLGSGPSEATANGVRHALALRRGTAAYPAASCTYLTASGRPVLIAGVPTTGARPR